MRPRTKLNGETGKIERTPATRGHCPCGKIAYSSRKVAAQQAAIARARTGHAEVIRPYHSEVCHAWHIGHPPGEGMRRALVEVEAAMQVAV